MTLDDLSKLLEDGEAEKCIAYFSKMSEKDRRKLAPFCLKWFRKIKRDEIVQTGPRTYEKNPLLPAAEVALFATATFAELKKLPWHARPRDEFVYDLLVDRKPSWIGPWTLTLLEEDRYWFRWSLIRRLMAAGLIDKPDHPNYYLGMISGLAGPRGRRCRDRTIDQWLLDDPDLLEDEVWRLFEYEGGGENSLANWDLSTSKQKWSDGLIALMKAGRLSRERLLHCSLDALDRDFNHYRARWFTTFYDALQPSPEEQAFHADRVLGILGVSAPNIVSWAFKRVQKLAKSGTYPPETLINGLQPVFQARQKGLVKKAIKLLERTAKDSPRVSSRAAFVAAGALGHEAADVQEAALDMIDVFAKTDDEEIIARIATYAETIAPSLRGRLDRWMTSTDRSGSPEDSQETAPLDLSQLHEMDATLRRIYGIDAMARGLADGRVDIPAASFDGTDIPRLAPEKQLRPIVKIDELIEVCSRVMEDDSPVDDAERAIDGLSRLCDVSQNDLEKRVGPALKRVPKLIRNGATPFVGISPAGDLCGLVYAWGRSIMARGKPKESGGSKQVRVELKELLTRSWRRNKLAPLGFLSRRSIAVAKRIVQGKAAPLLSAPTHAGGWIDPVVLVERVNSWAGDEPDVVDACLALLRLAPDRRPLALEQLNEGGSEWQGAIRYALGDEGVKIGESAALWIAAARSKSPWTDDEAVLKALPKHGPDAGLAAKYSFCCKTRERGYTDLHIQCEPESSRAVERNCVTVGFHTERDGRRELLWELGGIGGRTVGSVRWTATIWPLARESFFAGAANEIADNRDWWEAHWQNQALLEPLLDSGTPLRKMGLLLLVIGLAAKEPGEFGLATDAAIQAIEDGRLGSDNLGSMLADLLPTGLIKPGRWQKTLGEVARVCPVHALVVQQSLQKALHGDPKKMPRDYGKLLEILKELSIELGQSITHEPCREFLAHITGSGKAAKTAKALLAIDAHDFDQSGRPLMEQVLSQRLTAARDRQKTGAP